MEIDMKRRLIITSVHWNHLGPDTLMLTNVCNNAHTQMATHSSALRFTQRSIVETCYNCFSDPIH